MNRLVIIGNGFDLAHGLPTGYCDFINDFWKNLKKCYQTEQYTSLLNINPMYYGFLNQRNIASYRDLKESLNTYSKDYGYNYRADLHKCFTSKNENIFEFKNIFFQHICNKHLVQNWVDIENEYYRLLKECLEEPENSRAVKLNQEFQEIKNFLEKYLDENIIQQFNFYVTNDKFDEILKLFLLKPLNLAENPDHSFLKEFPKQDYADLIALDDEVLKSSNEARLQLAVDEGRIIQNNLVLNFNYTPVLDRYINATNERGIWNRRVAFGYTRQIQIHGRLNDYDNQINFGFGDEMDDDYKRLEKKDDNEYLKNIKSFQYLQNSNYKDMLDFIESGKFQVFIMGHSCGLSDRILLNKIFEHHNCRSIKVFYHQFDQPKTDGRTDNYTEIVQNISRHFNKKEMMREKIVNKSLCQPLPQNIRFAKIKNGSQS